MRNYYTLVVRENGKWAPQFGDYSRACVAEEMADMKYSNVGTKREDGSKIKAADFKIIKSGAGQASINAAVAELNETNS